jgi:hypothetical protein
MSARRDRDRAYREEMRFLEKYIGAKRWSGSMKPAEQEREERRRMEEEEKLRITEEKKWNHAYFNGDFKTIGYRWLPMYYTHKSFTVLGYSIEGRKVPAGRWSQPYLL